MFARLQQQGFEQRCGHGIGRVAQEHVALGAVFIQARDPVDADQLFKDGVKLQGVAPQRFRQLLQAAAA